MRATELNKPKPTVAGWLSSVDSVWGEFWFAPLPTPQIRTTRFIVGLVSFFLFLSYALIGNKWFTDRGWFDSTAGLFLVGEGLPDMGAEFRITPFYQNPQWVFPVAIVGAIASIALAIGRLAPIAALVAFLSIMFFHNRAPLLVTYSEPLVSAFLFYSILVPSGLYKSNKAYFATVGMRLIQIHFVLWIGFSLFSMLSNEGWWTGESVRRLIEDRQGLLPSSWGMPVFAECMTVLIVISQILFLICVARPSWRQYGFWAMLVFVLAMLIVIADWMYALTVVAGLLSLAMLPLFLSKRILAYS
ncbi:hypothetical protein SH449x_004423 [Pirellulaceae bacterium SH449]